MLQSTVAGVSQRRAEVEDVSVFNTLLNASGGPALFRATFGQYNFSMMVESSMSALIGVSEEEGKCLGFLVINDSPTVTTDNDTFLQTVAAVSAHIPDAKPANTLFLNFFLVDETSRFDSDKISFDLVRNAFAASPGTDYIVWLCPSKVRLGFWMEDNFVHVELPKEEEEPPSGSTPAGGIPSGVKLLYMHRNAFMPKLLVRTARVEDNDDLLPILRSSNPQIVAGQSDFFLADLIQSQDERNKFLVGVYKNSPVGMLATSLDVNVSLMTKIFDIDGFPDIIVAKEQKPHPPPLFISLMGEIRAVAKSVMKETVTNLNLLFVDAEEVLSATAISGSEEEKTGIVAGEEEEARLARLAMDQLKSHMVRQLELRQRSVGDDEALQHPVAVVVCGFPRTDIEAQELSQGYLKFDLMLELGDDSKSLSEQDANEDNDAFLKHHLDAVEALRTFTDAQPSASTPWYRVNLGADSGINDKDLYVCLSNISQQRVSEVERILAMEEQEPPKANAFAVTVFCIDTDFQSRGDDLLRVAFEDNPALDYCLYMVANAAPPSPGLTASMAIVKQRIGVTFDQTLYIVHRDAVLAADLLRVERLTPAQMAAVDVFATPLAAGKERDTLLKACADSIKQNDMDLKDNPPEVSFTVLMGEDVVGVVTASRNFISSEDVTWLRSNYHLDEVVNFDRHRLRSQAQITNFVINPVFSKWTRYIIREIMRKYGRTLIYYQNPVDFSPPQEILEEMIPVAPRRRMQTSPNGNALPMLEKPGSNGVTVESPLLYLTKRQLTQPKVTVTKKVVVVGGGSASYALLEKLLFVPHINFPNLQLVMELPPRAFKTGASAALGLEYSERCSGELSCDDADDPTMQELAAMGMAHRISIVRGRLTDIDRANKAIVISDEVISEYDVLVVASGTKDCSTKKFPTTAGTHPAHCALRGMFGLGDAASDAAALAWVRRQPSDRLQIVVYGHDLEAIGAVGILLAKGVDPSRITLVIAVSTKIVDVCHPFIVESALRNLKSSGVFIKNGFEIVDVDLTKFGSVQGVQIRSLAADSSNEDGPPKIVTLNCFSLLCCNSKFCDTDVFAAINESGIVYDGGVVVDKVWRHFFIADASTTRAGPTPCISLSVFLSHSLPLPRRTFAPTIRVSLRWEDFRGSREPTATSHFTLNTAPVNWVCTSASSSCEITSTPTPSTSLLATPSPAAAPCQSTLFAKQGSRQHCPSLFSPSR